MSMLMILTWKAKLFCGLVRFVPCCVFMLCILLYLLTLTIYFLTLGLEFQINWSKNKSELIYKRVILKSFLVFSLNKINGSNPA